MTPRTDPRFRLWTILLVPALLLGVTTVSLPGQEPAAGDTAKQESKKNPRQEGLPLEAARKLQFTTAEGSSSSPPTRSSGPFSPPPTHSQSLGRPGYRKGPRFTERPIGVVLRHLGRWEEALMEPVHLRSGADVSSSVGAKSGLSNLLSSGRGPNAFGASWRQRGGWMGRQVGFSGQLSMRIA